MKIDDIEVPEKMLEFVEVYGPTASSEGGLLRETLAHALLWLTVNASANVPREVEVFDAMKKFGWPESSALRVVYGIDWWLGSMFVKKTPESPLERARILAERIAANSDDNYRNDAAEIVRLLVEAQK